MSKRPLWSAAEAAEATGARKAGAWQAEGVSIDSRSVAPGNLFVAIEGPENDGHAFVADALVRDAAAAVVHRRPEGVDAGAPLLEVEDTLAALTALGAAARDRTGARIAAVTGSAGKTSTKEALGHVLGGQAPTTISAASYNNHWGVPLSLARMPKSTEYGIFEIGMSHPGEIEPLSRLVRPHVVIITNVEAAHTEFFSSLEEVADAKAEIFAGLEPGGICVLNRDNQLFERLRAAAAAQQPKAKVVSFGTDDADYCAREVTLDADGSTVAADLAGRRIGFRIALPGRHWVSNALAVLAAVDALGADIDFAATAFAELPALEGRGRTHVLSCRSGTFVLIDDSYNANPASVRAAIETLGRMSPSAGGRRIAVLGTMRELGPGSDALHADLAEPLIDSGIDLVYAAGDMRLALDRLPEAMRGGGADSGVALADVLAMSISAGDVVMVKGSNASGMGLVVESLRSASDGARPSHAL